MSALDLGALGRSVTKLRAVVPDDALTAEVLGSERLGNGVVIDSRGMVLTIGYLMTEATDVWLTAAGGREIAAHPLAYDQVTGFGLVVPLQELNVPCLPFGNSGDLRVGDPVYVISAREFAQPQTAQILALREFAGAWEYLLENAIFAAPAHPHWSGAALLDSGGALVGLGSLLVREMIGSEEISANMFVPIDVLKPILANLATQGRAARQARPWLGLYAVEVASNVYVTGVVEGGPAHAAGLREGDMIERVADRPVETLPAFYRRVWGQGDAGTIISIAALRDGARRQFNVRSVDRSDLLKRPAAH